MKPEGTTKRLEALDFDQIDDLAKAAWRVAAQQVRACGLEPIGATDDEPARSAGKARAAGRKARNAA